MNIKFTGERGTDYDGLTAKVIEITRDNGSKHYYAKFYDNGAMLTDLIRVFGNVDPAINAALGFTTGMELGDRA